MKKICKLIIIIFFTMYLIVYSGCANEYSLSDNPDIPSELSSMPELSSTSNMQQSSILPTIDTLLVSEPPQMLELTKKSIYYIAYSSNADPLQAGVTQAGIDLDCDFILQGVPYNDIEYQAQLLENAVESKADAIIVRALDRESLAEPVSKAYHTGIPIILVDIMVETEDYSVCLKTDDIDAGRQAAAEMLRKLKNTSLSENEYGEIAIQIALEESQTIRDRLEGFRTYWDENAPAQWVVLWDDVRSNGGDIYVAIENGKYFLSEYKSLVGVFAPNDLSTEGFAEVLKESNRTDITLVGFNLYRVIEELVRNEDFNVSTMMFVYKMGYDAMKIAYELANGGTVNEKVFYADVFTIDFKNIDDPEVQKWLW